VPLFFSCCETESTCYCGHCLAYCTSSIWWMMMILEHSVECELAGETELLGENLPQCHLSITNPKWTDPGSNPGHSVGKPATNRLSYGTASTCPKTFTFCSWYIIVTWSAKNKVSERDSTAALSLRFSSKRRFVMPSVENYKLLLSLFSIVAITLQTRSIFPSGGLSSEQE
jgi:hypothetical protein